MLVRWGADSSTVNPALRETDMPQNPLLKLYVSEPEELHIIAVAEEEDEEEDEEEPDDDDTDDEQDDDEEQDEEESDEDVEEEDEDEDE